MANGSDHDTLAGTGAHLSDPAAGPAPRISSALFNAAPGVYDPFRTQLEKDIASGAKKPVTLQGAGTFEPELKDLLGHVEERLRKGVGEAWCSRDGYDLLPADTVAAMEELLPLYKFCAAISGAGSEDDEEPDDADAYVQAQKNRLALFDTPEEKWARAVTEALSFIMYGGPQTMYSIPRIQIGEGEAAQIVKAAPGDDLTEEEMYKAFAGDSPVYPLAIACQHQATLMVLALGKSVADLTMVVKERASATAPVVEKTYVGLGCNGMSATFPAFTAGMKFTKKGMIDVAPPAPKATPAEKTEGAKSDAPPSPDAAPAKETDGAGAKSPPKEQAPQAPTRIPVTTEEVRKRTKPGDAVFFNYNGPESGDQTPGATGQLVHVGSVLRIWGGKLQYFDAGTLNNPSATAAGTDGGTTDHEWADDKLDGYVHMVGIGACGELPANLEEMAKKVSRARPLALARLVVFDAKSRSVGQAGVKKYRARFVSRFLHLWLDDAGVHLTNLMWSVRKPPAEGVRLAWWVYFPKGIWARDLLAEGAVNKAFSEHTTASSKGDALYNCNIIMGRADGGVDVYRRFEKKVAEGGASGWKLNFGTEVGLPSDEWPWLSIATPKADPTKEKLHTPQTFTTWAERYSAYDKVYLLQDPAHVAGKEVSGKVGVPFFDQASPSAASTESAYDPAPQTPPTGTEAPPDKPAG